MSSRNFMKSYFLFYKPYGVLSQFTREKDHKALCDFGPFPKNIYPVGRLDVDSEGLLMLTDDNFVKHRLTDPKFKHERKYLVQVEGIPENDELEKLRRGVIIGGKRTKPAKVKLLACRPDLPERDVPIRFRKNIPTSWLEVVLSEGRNRQVRKMTAQIDHPALRLVRTGISFLTLEGLNPGRHRQLTAKEKKELYDALKNL